MLRNIRLLKGQGGEVLEVNSDTRSGRRGQPNKGLLHFKGKVMSAILPRRLIIQLNSKSQIQLSPSQATDRDDN